MTARERYDEMLRERVWPLLQSLGFKRSRNRFGRPTTEGWQVLDFQASQFGSRNGVHFTINLGTVVAELQFRGDRGRKTPPPESDCHLRERIGVLLADQNDHWWDFDPDTDGDLLADELVEIIECNAVPWLEERSSLAQVLDLARARPNLLGWHDLSFLPRLLGDAGYEAEAMALQAEASRRRRARGLPD